MQDYKYNIPPVEKAINQLVKFIFYYRLVFVLAALLFTIVTALHVYQSALPGERLKNSALIITFGSIIIGIFYSILNYEHGQLKFRHDVKVSRETLTFTTSCKMHEADTIRHFKNIKVFYDDNKASFIQANFLGIQQKLKDNPEARTSFVLLFNYFEGISIAVLQGIMDESFMKEFFKTVFIEYHQYYGGYITHLRNEIKSSRVFYHFTQVAEKWQEEE
jgi:hypothetical protein